MKHTLIIPLSFCLAMTASATVVANYNFTSIIDTSEATETFLSPSTDTDTNSLASDITSPSTDFTSTAHTATRVNPEFGDVFNNGGNQAIGWSARANNPAQDFNVFLPSNTYFSFNIAAQGGATLDFTSITLLTGTFNTLGSNITAYDYTLSYSTDGTNFTTGSTILAGNNSGDAARLSGNGTATATISFDLSSITALQGVVDTAYFRVDPIASSGASQNGVQAQRAGFIDDVVVNATVIPEPSAALLGGLGLLALLRRRRHA
jgi:hypothetical protein